MSKLKKATSADVAQFHQLMRADAILFCAQELLCEGPLKGLDKHLVRARREVAQMLAPLQDRVYSSAYFVERARSSSASERTS
jgi:hypothetical protein